MKRPWALLVATVVWAGPAAAQRLAGSIGFAAGSVRARSRVGAADELATGAVIGGEAGLRLGRVTVDLAYLQGTLSPDTGSAESRDYVEGDAFLSVMTVPGVVVSVGPHARAYITTTGTQRWLFWTARLRGERALIGSAVGGFLELWTAWSADVNVSERFGHATGGVVGMQVRIPRSPVYARLTYGIERAAMGDGARLETVEGLSVVLGVGRRSQRR